MHGWAVLGLSVPTPQEINEWPSGTILGDGTETSMKWPGVFGPVDKVEICVLQRREGGADHGEQLQ